MSSSFSHSLTVGALFLLLFLSGVCKQAKKDISSLNDVKRTKGERAEKAEQAARRTA